jgi:hypothetical protein
MAFEKPLEAEVQYPTAYPQDEVEVEIMDGATDGESTVTELEDGGVLIDFDPTATSEGVESIQFGENLAESMDDRDLSALGSDIVSKFNTDRESRSDWERTYKDGIDLLGLKIEKRTKPFTGACGVTHPILTEAVVRFQSHAIGEIFPEGGPVRTKIHGKKTKEKISQAARVEEYMNYLTLEVMEEYREEMDRLLWSLCIAGSAFKKVYYSEELERPVAVFVPAEDMVVPYGASTLATTPRVTQIMREDGNWIKRRQMSGFYSDVDLPSNIYSASELKEAQDKTAGQESTSANDERYEILECHIDLDLEEYRSDSELESNGIADPYVVTVIKSTGKVLSIYQNWLPDDEKRKRRQHFTHYQYIPGFGFYGLGLIHLLGGIAKGATSILRQMVDAGSFATLPGGFKANNFRVSGDQTPIAPGEWRDVDVAGQKIQDSLMKAPYGEPSQVLFQLLNGLIEEGRRFASLADMNIGGNSGDLPIGTALAMIERDMKVMSSIQTRMHKALRDEFKIIVGIIQSMPTSEYPYEVDGGADQFKADFDARVDVSPVSDPNSSTAAHRIMKAQAALEVAKTLPPGEVKMKPLARYALEVMEIPNAKDIIPLEEDMYITDPITENMRILSLEPVKAFPEQNHQAHIQVHMLGMQDPKIQEVLADSPTSQASFGAMMAHVTEHVGYQYRLEIEQSLGVTLPPEGEQMPAEMEAKYSSLVAQAASKLFDKNTAMQAQAENEEESEDPIVQMRMAEQRLKELTERNRSAEKRERLQLDTAKLMQQDELARDRLGQDQALEKERIAGQLLGNVMRAAAETESLDSKERMQLAEFAMEKIKVEATRISAERDRDDKKKEKALGFLSELSKAKLAAGDDDNDGGYGV